MESNDELRGLAPSGGRRDEPKPFPPIPEESESISGEEDFFHDGRSWYVIHTYSGYENRVKTNLEHRIESMDAR